MEKTTFIAIVDELARANESAQIMKQLLEFKERNLIDSNVFMEEYKSEAYKLSDALASIVMYSGLDEMLKDSLVK